MRVEQEQKVTEDARRVAEQDAAAQKCATHAVQVYSSPYLFFILCVTYHMVLLVLK